MNENLNQQFPDRIKSETEELREDLMGLPVSEFKKVGDFGCGWGYITWSLAQEIPTSDCIGVDKFDHENPRPSIRGFLSKMFKIGISK